MKYFNPLWIAISTYSILPAPSVEWRREHMGAAICFLPVVGIFIGLALLLWQWLCLKLRVEPALFAAVAAVLPLLLTGGIHMDGFMDTMDALGSHQPRERKLEIMKDPNVGAFAVMGCGAYLLLSFGLYWGLYQGGLLKVAAVGFVLSRALGALGALTLPGAGNGGMLTAFTAYARNPGAVAAMVLVSCLWGGTMVLLDLEPGLGGVAFGILAFWGYGAMAKREFGGATGDTTGFFIQVCELFILFGVVTGGLL